MARFLFRFQKVLDARITYEDLAKRKFGEAAQEVRKQENIRDEFIRRREKQLQDMSERRRQPACAEYFAQDIQFEWVLKMKIKRQLTAVAKAKDTMERMRRKLVEAVKERKIMEKIRDKEWEEFRKMQNKNDIKFADEIAGRKAHFETSSIIGE